MYWWRSQLIPCFSDRKIEIYPFLSVQRGVSGWVLLVGEHRGSGGMENLRKTSVVACEWFEGVEVRAGALSQIIEG